MALLVGVPACSGAYIVVRHFGTMKTSGGSYLLTFAVLSGFAFYLFPAARLDGTNHALALVLVFVISLISGSALGALVRRFSGKA